MQAQERQSQENAGNYGDLRLTIVAGGGGKVRDFTIYLSLI
jgi:hypothetical protein